MKKRLEKRHSINRRVLLLIFGFSLFVTFALGSLKIYWNYQAEIENVKQSFRQIQKSNLKSIINSVWMTDEESLQTQLEGILQLPGIHRVEIKSQDSVLISLEGIPAKKTWSYHYPLIYSYNKKKLNIGTLVIVTSLDPIYERVIENAFVLLGGQALQTFLISIFVFLIFQYLVVRHLKKLVKHFNQNKYSNSEISLIRLNREENKKDELQDIVDEINEINQEKKKYCNDLINCQNSLKKEIEEREQIEQRLEKIKQEQDKEVIKQTKTLLHSNQKLEQEIVEYKGMKKRLVEKEQIHRKLAEEANAASLAKSEFLAVMSHEIRTSLNSVIGTSELLAESSLEKGQKDYVQSISHAGDSLLELLDNVLDSSDRLDSVVKKEAVESSTPLSNLNILLVEDVLGNRRLIQKQLEGFGFHVDTAEDGIEGVEKIQTEKYDVVFMDMQMPIMNGCDAIRTIRQWEKDENKARIPIIMLTANSTREDLIGALDSGCDHYLIKPAKKNELYQAIEKTIQF